MHNKTSDDPLLNNCRPNWPEWTCIGANVCGFCSTTLWFLVLLPQVWKNFRQRSVLGLSILWGTANFTASLINLCFVYGYAEIPLYDKINATYMPILEFSILVQFWIYGHQYSKKHKIAYLVVCLCVWSTLISLNLGLKLFPYIQWIAIGLWCIETFPQVFLNFKLRSTAGQSTRSVIIATIGKMTDFLSTYGLVLPTQYIVMTYFSSSVNYVNAIQVVWFYGRKPSQRNEDMVSNIRYKEFDINNDQEQNTQRDSLCSTRYVQPNFSFKTRRAVRYSLIAMFTSFLCLFAYGIIWATESFYAIFAPVTLISVTGFALFWYRRTWKSESEI